MNKVLVVDDSKYVRAALRVFLRVTMQLEICGEAGDGFEAVMKATELRPDLILMDVAMPRMNGVEAALAIKSMYPETRIVLFTFWENSVHTGMAKAAGVDLVLSKSAGTATLLESIRAILSDGAPAISPS
ncbi:MAG TPA: response regulator transcription factor [Candidatus Acidoferrales bacterium]|nr:response regulator transcription factor [Candidatus Acidoferrales bacterium]